MGAGIALIGTENYTCNCIRNAVDELLSNESYKINAEKIGKSLRDAGGYEKAAEIIGCNTCENIVIHGNGHTDTIALAGTETAGKCNLAVKLILGNSLLKKLYQFFRPFQMAG